MLDPVQTLIFGLVIGFAVSGVFSNVFQMLVTNGRSLLAVQVTSDTQRLAVVAMLLLAGPHILVRAANRSLQAGDWPAAYTAGCFGLGLLWSFVLGFAVLAVFLG